MPRTRRRTRAVATGTASAAIVAALALGPGFAGAHDQRFDNRVTMRGNPQFHGRVISEKAGCERRRLVQVYREDPGPDGGFANTMTDNEGRWEVNAPSVNGDFYARIRRTDVGSGGHNHICRRDRSRSVHAGM